MARMVVIHGRNAEHANPDKMLEDIRAALVPSLQNAGVEVPSDKITLAFYGDLFLTAGKVTAARARTKVARTTKIAGELAKAHPASHPRAPRLLRPVTDRPWWKPLAEAVSGVLTGLDRTVVFVQLFIFFTMHDVALYLDDPALRTAIAERVRATVTEAATDGEDVLVLAHSLGSIVAYELLHKWQALSVRQLVTLGSPLGSATIQETIRRDVPLAFPPELTDWLNISFENDYVASVHDFSADFPSGDDRRIVNLDASRESPLEWLPWLSHDLDVYLSAGDTATAVARLLKASHPDH
jgi:hypothetical protein